MTAPTALRSCSRTVALFAVSGFLAGFIGPMVLRPESNIGPLIGILFSGPAGALLGAIACVLARLAPRVFGTAVLRGLAAALALVTLYYCLPDPRAVESVLDAEVADCREPLALYAEALRAWEEALAHAPQARPLPDWRQQALHGVEDFAALAVTMHVVRSRVVFEKRRPWDRGERFAGPWSELATADRTYFVAAASGTCGAWQTRARALYWPVRDESDPPIRPAPIWPPVDAAGFLSLQEIGPVPARIQALLQ
jgi:hypothetical protein